MNPNSSCKADLDQRSRPLAPNSKRAVDNRTRHHLIRLIGQWSFGCLCSVSGGVTAVQHRGDAFYMEFLGMGREWVGSQANS